MSIKTPKYHEAVVSSTARTLRKLEQSTNHNHTKDEALSSKLRDIRATKACGVCDNIRFWTYRLAGARRDETKSKALAYDIIVLLKGGATLKRIEEFARENDLLITAAREIRKEWQS